MNGGPVYVMVSGCDGERTGGADNGRFPSWIVLFRVSKEVPGDDSSGLTMRGESEGIVTVSRLSLFRRRWIAWRRFLASLLWWLFLRLCAVSCPDIVSP